MAATWKATSSCERCLSSLLSRAVQRVRVNRISPMATVNPPAALRRLAYPMHNNRPRYTSLSDAISRITSGSQIYVQGLAATPTELLDELCRQVDSGRLDNIRLNHTLLSGHLQWADKKYEGKIRSNCLFLDDQTRKLVKEGRADYTPIFLSDIGHLCSSFTLPLDAVLVTVSPPDENNFCSLGVTADASVEAVRSAKLIIALENKSMPHTCGDTTIHTSHIDCLVRLERERAVYAVEGDSRVSVAEARIGRSIAENLVDNGATLQMGIGSVPDSTMAALVEHKDLGIHSEMVSDGVIELLRRGVVNNAKKSVDPGKAVATFAFGTRKLYNFINNNDIFLFRSCCYTNNTQVIRRQRKMTAINGAIEIDLTGQVSADSIGTSFYSGFGGQVDFIYGSAMADDGQGRPIIALPSSTAKGDSKIVPFLKEGAGVVTTRGLVRYVVTEYGIAQLWGKSVRQRAYQLIHIAHPDHRESLEKAAFGRLRCMPSKD